MSPTRPFRALARWWQGSIQVRVVATTLALSILVMSLLATTLLRQISSGLLRSQVEAAVDDTAAGVASARTQLQTAQSIDPATVGQLLTAVVQNLAGAGAASGRYDVVLLRAETTDSEASAASRATRTSRGVDPRSVPEELRTAVRDTASLYWTYTTVRYQDGSTSPGLAVGSQVAVPSIGVYELYYLFPLDEQVETLALVSRSVASVGVLVVLLLSAIALVVVRQVARPVQQAAVIAEQLAGGELDERMVVPPRDPKDELGRLAQSFNHMAGSLQQQITQLEELSRLQQRFVSDVSHELRTPLTTVRMAADVLHDQSERLDPATRRASELLQSEMDRFESLLGDLLEISRIDAGAAALDLEDVDLRDVISSVCDGLAPLARDAGVELLVRIPSDQVTVVVDPRRVARILRNLVANAIEHGERRPVEVTLGASPDAVAVTVRDHGIGLDAEQLDLVFSRFWRADPARTRTTGGSGLGLAISLEDARMHGGRLQAWGQRGVGSSFRLTLPRVAGQVPGEPPLPLVPEDAPTQTFLRPTEVESRSDAVVRP
jgi:two-component system, OmpR family, sensor histidine kinase MtrB